MNAFLRGAHGVAPSGRRRTTRRGFLRSWTACTGGALALLLLPGTAPAAQLTIERTARPVTLAEIAGGADPAAWVHDFYATGPDDVLSIELHRLSVPVFRNPIGRTYESPTSLELETSPSMSAHTFITTPGNTWESIGNLARGEFDYSDAEDTGPLSRFNFSRITTVGGGTFEGALVFYGSPLSIARFTFDLPSNPDVLAGLNQVAPFVREYAATDSRPSQAPDTTRSGIRWDLIPNHYFYDPQGIEPRIPQVNASAFDALWTPVTPTVRAVTSFWQESSSPLSPAEVEKPAELEIPQSYHVNKPIAQVWKSSRAVTTEEASDGAPAGGVVHEFFVSSLTDLLSVNSLFIETPFWEHVLANRAEVTPAILTTVAPGVSASTYFTTPGSTGIAGSEFTLDSFGRSYFDTDFINPLDAFKFGQIAVPSDAAEGEFRVTLSFKGVSESHVRSLPVQFLLTGDPLKAKSGLDPLFSLYDDYGRNQPPVVQPPTTNPPIVIPPDTNPPITQPPVVVPQPGPRYTVSETAAGAAPAVIAPTVAALAEGDVVAAMRLEARSVTAEEAAAGAPADGVVFEFFLDSAFDILSVSEVRIDGALFQSSLGTLTGPTPDVLATIDPSLSASTWITTPGDTATAGGGVQDPANPSVFFDVEDNGAVDDFKFAQITLAGGGSFRGSVGLANRIGGSAGVVDFPFEFALNPSDVGAALPGKSLAYDPIPVPVDPPVVDPPIVGPIEPTDPPVVDPTLPVDPYPGNPADPVEPPGNAVVDVPGATDEPIFQPFPIDLPGLVEAPIELPAIVDLIYDPFAPILEVDRDSLRDAISAIRDSLTIDGLLLPTLFGPNGERLVLFYDASALQIDGLVLEFAAADATTTAIGDGLSDVGLSEDAAVLAFSQSAPGARLSVDQWQVVLRTVAQFNARIPEPGGAALAAVGMAALALARRRPADGR